MKSIICAACDLFQCNNSHKVDWEELLCSRNIILHFLFGRFLLMCGFFISNSNTIKKVYANPSGAYTYVRICDTRLTFTPVLVFQVRPSLLASTAAVTVVPLLPPQPTSITPSRGTRRSVRIVISVVRGVTCDGQSAG